MAKKLGAQITLRISDDWLHRIEALRPHLAQDGVEVTQADAIRVVIGQGLPVVEDLANNKSRPVERGGSKTKKESR